MDAPFLRWVYRHATRIDLYLVPCLYYTHKNNNGTYFHYNNVVRRFNLIPKLAWVYFDDYRLLKNVYITHGNRVYAMRTFHPQGISYCTLS